MKRPKRNQDNSIYSRLSRIERKCDCIIARLDRQARGHRNDDVDSIVRNLRDTAKAIAKESEEERLFFADIVSRYRK